MDARPISPGRQPYSLSVIPYNLGCHYPSAGQ